MTGPKSRQIHVLVVVPKKSRAVVELEDAAERTALWLIHGSIANAFNTRGVRCKLYRLAGLYLGYYDPARCTDHKFQAFWYAGDGTTLLVHVLFRTEEYAVLFENALRDEPATLGSPLSHQQVTTDVKKVEGVATELQRIFFVHYDPNDTDSLQDAVSSISQTSDVTLFDGSTDEFKFQRIEDERLFLSYGKAESCHLVLNKHCTHRDFKREFGKYNNDVNNRLALSREMHGYFDGMSMEVPIVNMFPGCVDKTHPVNNKFKVEVFVKVFDAHCKDRVFGRLKEGSARTDDPLMRKTYVYVQDPDTFCFCLKWKFQETEGLWADFLQMTPAVE